VPTSRSFDVTQGAKPIFGPATRSLPQLTITVDDEGFFVARSDYIEAVGAHLLEPGAHLLARTATAPGAPKTVSGQGRSRGSTTGSSVAGPAPPTLNKVYPDHWSFLLGEIALYSFLILLLSGTYLTFFFDASMREVVYEGSYAPLRGVEMSAAYDSALQLSFDVRGGLFMRQLHHWAALLFVASIVITCCVSSSPAPSAGRGRRTGSSAS
jgi:hypothetical protein